VKLAGAAVVTGPVAAPIAKTETVEGLDSGKGTVAGSVDAEVTVTVNAATDAGAGARDAGMLMSLPKLALPALTSECVTPRLVEL